MIYIYILYILAMYIHVCVPLWYANPQLTQGPSTNDKTHLCLAQARLRTTKACQSLEIPP